MTREDRWAIEFYRDGRGRSPVEDFIRGLDSKMRIKLFRSLDLLEEFGDRLEMPLARPMTGYRFSELRVQSGGNIARVFFFVASGRRVVMLHGFVKKTRQTPRRELDIGSRRRDEFMRGLG